MERVRVLHAEYRNYEPIQVLSGGQVQIVGLVERYQSHNQHHATVVLTSRDDYGRTVECDFDYKLWMYVVRPS